MLVTNISLDSTASLRTTTMCIYCWSCVVDGWELNVCHDWHKDNFHIWECVSITPQPIHMSWIWLILVLLMLLWSLQVSKIIIFQCIFVTIQCFNSVLSASTIQTDSHSSFVFNSVFSRSYCYSMIGYWHKPVVHPSVCLSVCNAVHCGSQGRFRGLKVVPTWS